MGSDGGHGYIPGPCANCGKPGQGYMSSSAWGHDYMCCSQRCGKRLGQRIENGMYQEPDGLFPGSFLFLRSEDTVNPLRIRIKQLEHQLKEVAGGN